MMLYCDPSLATKEACCEIPGARVRETTFSVFPQGTTVNTDLLKTFFIIIIIIMASAELLTTKRHVVANAESKHFLKMHGDEVKYVPQL